MLPSSGGWETKVNFLFTVKKYFINNSHQSVEYLRDVNPAGTVPVLIHNGHPVYESHEQILYIDQAGFTILHLKAPNHQHHNPGADARRTKVDAKRPREEEGDGQVGRPRGNDHEVSH